MVSSSGAKPNSSRGQARSADAAIAPATSGTSQRGSGPGACEATDQRAAARPGGTRCDIGTFEITTACVAGGSTLCLNNGRFKVTATRVAAGTTAHAQSVTLTGESGYFWFFHPDNVELVVKILDGRPVNGKFWVFYGALSNVQYTIDIRHVLDDWFQWPVYENPLGHFASVADIDAFVPPDPALCICPAGISAVCGRDGKTYSNECEAHCFGWVAIEHSGSCEPH